MNQYFNIYVVFDKNYNTRMFRKNIGEINTYDTNYYRLSYSDAINEFDKYRESHEDDELIMLVEDKIPKEGTVYNFVPRRDYVKED